MWCFFFKVNKYKCKRISKHKYHLNILFSLKRLENEGSQSKKIYRFSHGNLCSCEAYGIKPNEYCFTYTCPAYGLTCEKEFASSTPNQDQERQRLSCANYAFTFYRLAKYISMYIECFVLMVQQSRQLVLRYMFLTTDKLFRCHCS